MSVNDIDTFSNILRTNDYRLTKARIETFKLLVGSGPQSISQLLKKAGNTIDRVTLYRNIGLFEDLAIVHRVYIGWKYRFELSDDFIEHHHHLSCLRCGKVINIGDDEHINGFIKDVGETYSFVPTRHQFEISGYCAGCVGQADTPVCRHDNDDTPAASLRRQH